MGGGGAAALLSLNLGLAEGGQHLLAHRCVVLTELAVVFVVLHVRVRGELLSCLVVDHDLVAILLALEELELAAHASLDERARQVLDPVRAELPLPSVHVVPEGDGHAPALGLGAEELVEGLEALAFSAHRCWRVARLNWVSMVWCSPQGSIKLLSKPNRRLFCSSLCASSRTNSLNREFAHKQLKPRVRAQTVEFSR